MRQIFRHLLIFDKTSVLIKVLRIKRTALILFFIGIISTYSTI